MKGKRDNTETERDKCKKRGGRILVAVGEKEKWLLFGQPFTSRWWRRRLVGVLHFADTDLRLDHLLDSDARVFGFCLPDEIRVNVEDPEFHYFLG